MPYESNRTNFMVDLEDKPSLTERSAKELSLEKRYGGMGKSKENAAQKKSSTGDGIIKGIRNSQFMKGAKGLLNMDQDPKSSFFGQLAKRMSSKEMQYYNTLADRDSYGPFGDASAARIKAGERYKSIETQEAANLSKGLATPTAILKAKTQIHNKLMGGDYGGKSVRNPITGKMERYDKMSDDAQALYTNQIFDKLRNGYGVERIKTMIAGDARKDQKVKEQASNWLALSKKNPGISLLLKGINFGKDTAYVIAGAYMEMYDYLSDPENTGMLERLADETSQDFAEGEVGAMILAFAKERGEDIGSTFKYIEENMSLNSLKQWLINRYQEESSLDEIKAREQQIMDRSEGGPAVNQRGGLLNQNKRIPRPNANMWPGQGTPNRY